MTEHREVMSRVVNLDENLLMRIFVVLLIVSLIIKGSVDLINYTKQMFRN